MSKSSVVLEIDKDQIENNKRFDLIGRSLNLAMKEMGESLEFQFDSESDNSKVKIKINKM